MNIISLLCTTVRLAAPTILIALGGMFCLRINLFNLGLEGFMLLSSFFAIVGAYLTNSMAVGFLLAVLIGAVLMLIYGLFTLELNVDPVVGGIAIVSIASGLTRFLLSAVFGQNGRLELFSSCVLNTLDIPLLRDIPYLNRILNNHSPIIYFALLCPFLLNFLFYRTSYGLSLRAIGQSTDVAEAAGINTRRIKYIALLIGGVLAGLSGAQLSLSANLFNIGMSNGRGYTAIAALILARARPIPTFLSCLLFGFADALVITISGYGLPSQFLSMLPYVLAILVAVLPYVFRSIGKNIQLQRFNHSMHFPSGIEEK